ncbi:hypothetical protein GTW63_41040 [Streptomyces sp. SID6137]|nr:hypothetical protein [Streptomyces sp. SID6137]MYR24612.1 hypothetical protein [Streptomyces sp. SID6137]
MDFVRRTIDLARHNVAEGGRPFATVIVKDGEILAESPNRVAQTNDPTAHAEILAIREACVQLGTEHLTGEERDHAVLDDAHPPDVGGDEPGEPDQQIHPEADDQGQRGGDGEEQQAAPGRRGQRQQ